MKNRNPIPMWLLLLLTAAVLLLGGCGELSSSLESTAPRAGNPRTAPSSPVSVPGQAPSPTSAQGLKVHFIDIGQGDSILAESEGHFMLIDAGENDQGQKVVSYLKQAGVTSLDYIIGTHPHSDHIGGLDDVLREFPAKKLILPPVEHTTRTFEDVLDIITDKGMKITMPRAGDSYPLGSASFTILAPAGDYGDDLNNWSVGLRLSYKNNHMVMCGDAEKEAEADIIAYNEDLSADVLKVGHHGSSTSTSDAFLEAISPSYAVIQCGKDNSYGHPHKETLEKLEKAGAQVLRTDLEGTIVASCDGSSVLWSTDAQVVGQATLPSSAPDSGSWENTAGTAYVLNISTRKFHLPSCQSVSGMKEANRQDVTDRRDALIEAGYSPCGQCKP